MKPRDTVTRVAYRELPSGGTVRVHCTCGAHVHAHVPAHVHTKPLTIVFMCMHMCIIDGQLLCKNTPPPPTLGAHAAGGARLTIILPPPLPHQVLMLRAVDHAEKPIASKYVRARILRGTQ